jgi:pimeloyl-ACP methyl ester carboxylesterase
VAHFKQAKIAIFDESSHHPFIDEPEAFARLVSAFLRA